MVLEVVRGPEPSLRARSEPGLLKSGEVERGEVERGGGEKATKSNRAATPDRKMYHTTDTDMWRARMRRYPVWKFVLPPSACRCVVARARSEATDDGGFLPAASGSGGSVSEALSVHKFP